jgi:hypothetical protein
MVIFEDVFLGFFLQSEKLLLLLDMKSIYQKEISIKIMRIFENGLQKKLLEIIRIMIMLKAVDLIETILTQRGVINNILII